MKVKQSLGQWLVSTTILLNPDNALYSGIPEFLQNDTSSQLLKNTLMGMFYNYPLRGVYADNNAIIEDAILTFLNTNHYRYTTLFDTMNYEYNPIENYRMVEEGNDITNNSVQGTDNYGNYNETNTQAATVDSTTHGGHTDQIQQTNNQTEHSDVTSRNAYTDVDTRKVAPEDTTTFYNAEQNDNQHGNQQETVQYGAMGDTQDTSNIYASYTDNVNVGERKATVNRDSYSNNAEQKSLNSFTHYFTRSGNIGVTTSQQMIEAERNVAEFNIYQIIATDIMQLLCLRTYIPIHAKRDLCYPYHVI